MDKNLIYKLKLHESIIVESKLNDINIPLIKTIITRVSGGWTYDKFFYNKKQPWNRNLISVTSLFVPYDTQFMFKEE